MGWKRNPFPWPGSYISASTAQYLFGLLLQGKYKVLGTNHRVNWIAFVQMQPHCRSLPRNSPNLGFFEQEAALKDPDHF